jgi:ABC-2 type transport system permease protein
MNKLWGVIYKELLVLWRDIPALMFLFIMPALLLIIISVTEDNVANQNRLTILLIAPDSSEIANDIENGLLKSEFFKVKNIIYKDTLEIQKAKKEIADGKYQAGIVIPSDASWAIEKRAEEMVEFSDIPVDSIINPTKSKIAGISVCFDPAIKEALKYSLKSALNGILISTEIKTLIKKYFAFLEEDIKVQFKAKMDSLKQKKVSVNIPDLVLNNEINKEVSKTVKNLSSEKFSLKIPKFPWQPQSIIKLIEEYANNGQGAVIKPSVSQNRIPGFTLFAMFFIVIPLAGSIITERNEGAFDRLRTLQVSYFTLLAGKVILYTFICLLQFVFMLSIGFYILPQFFNMPELVIGTHYAAVFVTALMSSLAAIGFGLLVGTIAKSHAQASTFGSLMIVILGLLGGVFIPVYLIPVGIKSLTAFSPLRWGIDAFIDLFVRNEGFSSICLNLVGLFSFFLLSLIISTISYSKRS